jgi:ribosome-binding factor A
MSLRGEKVGSVIKRALAGPLSDLASEFRAGLVTLTSVKLSDDLQIAKVYISVYGGKISAGQFLDRLEPRIGELRTYIGSKVRLRFTPELRFYLDDTLEQISHIQKLLDKIKTENHTD